MRILPEGARSGEASATQKPNAIPTRTKSKPHYDEDDDFDGVELKLVAPRHKNMRVNMIHIEKVKTSKCQMVRVCHCRPGTYYK